MAHGYNLAIIPEDATYRPSTQQMTGIIKFLCERLEITGEWSVGGEDELSNESAIDHLRAACPACTQRFSQISEILDEIRATGDPVLCPCGAKTLPEDLKKSAGVNLASFAIVFTGNRGWYYEVKNDRDAFKDEEFLTTLEELLGTKVQVVAVQH